MIIFVTALSSLQKIQSMPHKILVPVDFTELSDKVIEQAAFVSSTSGSALVLLHIAERTEDLAYLTVRLANKAAEAASRYKVDCESKVREGSIFKEIQSETEEIDYGLVIIGTHGVHGLKQKLMGADILKIITKVPVPALVVQSTSPLRTSFGKIVLPVATHLAYENILQAVVMIGKLFKPEVYIYSIERPGFEWPDQLKKNLELTKEIFDDNGIRYIRVNEKQTVLSVGFARQTIQYARETGADMIAMMSVPSDEYHYFAQQDKENLLTNDYGIPVLCASNHAKRTVIFS
jgi:nucleotide-binding universal stress UspA family protein